MIKSIEELNSIFSFICLENLENKCLLFETKKNKYLYDTGTSKVILLSSEEYTVLSSLIKQRICKNIDDVTVRTVAAFVKCENLLQGILNKDFYDPDRDYIKDKVSNKLSQMTLEVTQQCNLRCKYCIYGSEHLNFRDFDSKEMSWDTAKKAIEYAKNHSGKDIVISFYGGEPLIRFDLVKKAVNYALEIMKDKNVSFSMTTNMILMDEDKARFIAQTPHFSTTASIDGPEYIHDANRVDRSGKGTFFRAIRGLETLALAIKECNKDLSEHISVSMVLDQPFLNSKYDDIEKFFESLEWLPREVEKMVTYADYPFEHEISQPRQAREYIDEWVLKKNDINNFYKGTIESVLYPIHVRNITEEPQEHMKMNGCCIPGSRKLYVTSDGEFKVCERIGESPAIGNVEDGIDFEKLFGFYIDEFREKGKLDCANCWASTLCNVCYARYYNKTGFDRNTKLRICGSSRQEIHDFLIIYHTFLEENPEVINRLNDMKAMY